MQGSQQVANSPRLSPGEVISNLKDANDPIEFIRANLSPNGPQATEVPPPADTPVQTEVVPEPPTKEPPSFQDDLNLPFDTEESPKAEPVKEEKKEEEKKEEEKKDSVPANELLESVSKKKGPQDSLRDLRKKTTELSKQLQEKDTLLQQVQGEIEKFKTGEAIPDVVKEKDERISKLEYYENLHALRLSPEYQKKYVEPIEELKTKAGTLAGEYGVDTQIVNQALTIDNKKDLHAFLSKHFDPVAALEMRECLQRMKDINNEAIQAENQPREALEQIKGQFAVQEQERERQRVTTITNNSRDGWVEALTELRTGPEYPELTLKGEENHDKISKQILEAAAGEYGKFIKLLGLNGTKDLPKDAAKILAKRFLLSQAAGIMAQSRAHHYTEAQKIISDTKRSAPFVRPPIGSGTQNGGGVPQKASSPTEAAEMLLQKVLPRR